MSSFFGGSGTIAALHHLLVLCLKVLYYLPVMASGESCAASIEVYAMLVTHEESKWRECKERKRKWLGPAEASRRVQEPALATLLLRMVDLFPMGMTLRNERGQTRNARAGWR